MLIDTLNDRQKEAVLQTEGPLLILAGAGSGKTRVITHRIAYLIEEMNVAPWNIMAITFTNKAAGEMRERVNEIVGYGSESIWVSTFHSSCVRILRRHIDKIGYQNNFTIYDTDDQKTVVKEIMKRLNIDSKNTKERTVLSVISSAKNQMISAEQFMKECGDNFGQKQIARIFKEYQEQLKKNNALDFDDLLVKAVELFQTCPDVLESYQERFRYIMVDEYQDTNTVQFQFVKLLASKYRNLCVVGDDDQSIYKFRGADISNILDFEKVFPDATVIKLEQNYRSVGNILKAANGVISNNRGRKDKELWTEREDGTPISLRLYETAYEEADGIAASIEENVVSGKCKYRECACLYRTNAQSRSLEEKLIARNIPYKLFGGVNFYQRKEVKDMLAYLKTIDNAVDDVSVKRIINIPKRGIGQTTIDKVQAFANEQGISFYEALKHSEGIGIATRTVNKIQDFINSIRVYRSKLGEFPLTEIFKDVMDTTGYVAELKLENTEESLARVENIEELLSKLAEYEKRDEQPTLSGFLEEVALVADIDAYDENSDYVVLMTIHSSKGLEFPYVYLSGMEDGLFPSYMTMMSDDPTEIEEERRLCYVAITRAMNYLAISYAKSRMIRGEIQYNKASRFLAEIPPSVLENKGKINTGLGGFAKTASKTERKLENSYYQAKNAFNRPAYTGVGGFGKKGSMDNTIFDKKPVTSAGNLDGFGKKGSMDNTIFDKKPATSTGNLGGFGKKAMSASDLLSSGLVKQGVTKAESTDGLGYEVGDTVKHIKFGKGTVVSIVDAGRDYEVSVDFAQYGVKKLFAQFAKLVKVE